jgi:hypothetical protein
MLSIFEKWMNPLFQKRAMAGEAYNILKIS